MQINHNIGSIFRCCFGSCMNSAQSADLPFRKRILPNRSVLFTQLRSPRDQFFLKMSRIIARAIDFWAHLRSDLMVQGDNYKSAWLRKANHHRTKYLEGSSLYSRLDYQPKSCIWVLSEKGVS